MKKIGVPIPMQVLLVVIGIPLSIYLKLADEHGVAEVGQIPQGLPHVSLPDLHLAQYLIFDSLIIAIVGFGFTLSMAKLIAKKFGYSLNGNQELFAEVIDGNIFTTNDCRNSSMHVRILFQGHVQYFWRAVSMFASICIDVKINGSSYSWRNHPANRPRLFSHPDWSLGLLWIRLGAFAKGKNIAILY